VRKKVLIEQGVLLGYLHNTYTAAKGSSISTGNAVRGGFSSMPTVGITNLYIEPYQGPAGQPGGPLRSGRYRAAYP